MCGTGGLPPPASPSQIAGCGSEAAKAIARAATARAPRRGTRRHTAPRADAAPMPLGRRRHVDRLPPPPPSVPGRGRQRRSRPVRRVVMTVQLASAPLAAPPPPYYLVWRRLRDPAASQKRLAARAAPTTRACGGRIGQSRRPAAGAWEGVRVPHAPRSQCRCRPAGGATWALEGAPRAGRGACPAHKICTCRRPACGHFYRLRARPRTPPRPPWEDAPSPPCAPAAALVPARGGPRAGPRRCDNPPFRVGHAPALALALALAAFRPRRTHPGSIGRRGCRWKNPLPHSPHRARGTRATSRPVLSTHCLQ